jgi:LAO/AO transport system kinase
VIRRGRRLSADEYVEGVLRGDRTILSQAITLIESRSPADTDLAQDVLEHCLRSTGVSIRVGITGVPGAGKSTLIEVLGAHLTRERGEKVAVLAVDPSSQVSRGSILGDKTRMETLANDERAFIRASPSGGSLGGVARRTRETMLLCEAAGYRNILIETVGVGQSETAVRSMVDFFLLLMLAGAGDYLQGMKRGIIEMTDLIAVNKAEGLNRANAEAARSEMESALQMFALPETGWKPRAITCSALERQGIGEIWEAVLDHHDWLTSTGQLESFRREQVKAWLYELIEQALRDEFMAHEGVRANLAACERDVLAGRVSAFRAARRLIEIYKANLSR